MKQHEQTTYEKLATELVTPERTFPPRTPHTYSHLGEALLELYQLLPVEQE